MRVRFPFKNDLFLKSLFILYLLVCFPPVLARTYFGEGDFDIEGVSYFLPLSIPIKALVAISLLAGGFLWSRWLWRRNYLTYLIVFIGLLSPTANSPVEHFIGFLNLFLAYSFFLMVGSRLGHGPALRLFFFYNLALLLAGYVGLALGSDFVYQCNFLCSVEYYKGLYSGKNTLGLASALTIFMLLNFKDKLCLWRPIWAFLTIILLVGLVHSDSRAPLLALIGCIGFQAMAKSYWHSPRTFFVLLICLVVLSVTMIFAPRGDVLSLLGRDVTMSGRVNIWMDVFQAADFHVFYGEGIGSSVASIGAYFYGFYAIDNSWIVMAIELGMAVTAAYILWVARNIISPFRSRHLGESVKGALFFFLLIYGFAEKGAMLSVSQLFLFAILVSEWAKASLRKSEFSLIVYGEKGNSSS